MRENSVNRDFCDGAAGENLYFLKCLRTVCKGKTALLTIRLKNRLRRPQQSTMCASSMFFTGHYWESAAKRPKIFDSLKLDFSDFDAAYSLKRDDSLKWDFEGFAVPFT